MKYIFFALLIVLAACSAGGANMTRESFDDIGLGTPMQEVTRRVGDAYSIRSTGPDKEEYEYIERVAYGNELFYVNHYYLDVTGGLVVGKRIKQERRPAYDLLFQEDPNYYSYP